MDRSVPTPAAHILEFIYRTETGREPPDCYDVVYGQRQNELPKPLTKMTFDEVVKDGPNRTRKFGSSAAGAGQFMCDTLDTPKSAADLKGQMGISGDELFSPDLQDRMAYHLLNRRGYEKFMAGTMSLTAFAKALAQEWASFPVLATTDGAHRKVARGETYYAGDRLNRALVPPTDIEKLLTEAKAMKGHVAPAPAREPVDEPTETDTGAITDEKIVAQVQARLFELGYTEVGSKRPDGTFDGVVGKMTKTAILAFRNEHDMPLVDYIDQDLRIALMDASPRDLPAQRTEAKPADVREQVPEARSAWWTKVVAWVAGSFSAIGLAIDGVLDNLDGARGWLEPLKNTIGDVPLWVWFGIVLGGALFLWHKSRKGEVAIQTAYQTGERR